MKKWRRIYIYITAVVFAAIEVAGGILAYSDRNSTWFRGLAAILYSIILAPALLGMIWAVFEATDCFEPGNTLFGWKRLGFSALRALAVFAAHGIISPIAVALMLNETLELDMILLYPLWSIGVGAAAFAVVYLLIKLTVLAVREYKAYSKRRKENTNV